MTGNVSQKQVKAENPANGLEAISAFFSWYHVKRTDRGAYDYVFEHGQLWIHCPSSGGQWSVVDASGDGSVEGYSFECVTEPDEDAELSYCFSVAK